MAEINVPAWPIPIHHTKLTIAKPQPTGMLIPQIPNAPDEKIADREQQDLYQHERNRKPKIQPSPWDA